MYKQLLIIFALSFLPTILFANDLAEAIDIFENRDYRDARDRFESIAAERSSDPEILFYLAVTQFRTGDFEVADSTLEDLFAVAPNHLEGHYLLGVVNMALLNEVNIFKKMGVAKRALGAWEKMVEIDPVNALGHYAVFSFLMQAPGIAGGDKEEAKRVLEKMLELNSPYAELAKAMIAIDKSQFEQAEQHYINATKQIKDRGGPYFALAQYYFNQERYQDALDALAEYESGTKTWYDPDKAVIHFYRGTTFAKMGNSDQAKVSLDFALSQNPNKSMKGLIEKALEDL